MQHHASSRPIGRNGSTPPRHTPSSVCRRAATLATVLICGAAPAVSAATPTEGMPSRTTATPTGCGFFSGATDSNRRLGHFAYGEPGRPLQQHLFKQGLDFTPRTVATLFDPESNDYLMTDDRGRLLEVVIGGHAGTSPGVIVLAESGWGDVRKLVDGYGDALPRQFYADRGNGVIERWERDGADGKASLKRAATMRSPEWSEASFVTQFYPTGRNASLTDIFVGVHRGRLMEWRARRNGTQITSTVLQSSGWADTRLATGRCDSDRKSRVIYAFRPNGRVYGYLDADGFDGKGSDISPVGLAARGLTATVWPGIAQ